MKYSSFSYIFSKTSILCFALLTIQHANTAWATHNASHDCNVSVPGPASNRFVAQTDGTVVDSATGLTWMRCNVGQVWSSDTKTCAGYADKFTWSAALDVVATYNQEQLGLSRKADWRLPNIKELASIISLQCQYYAIDEALFPYTEKNYWTSSPVLNRVYTTTVYAADGITPLSYKDEHMAWTINFGEGREDTQPISKTFPVRLVRNTGP